MAVVTPTSQIVFSCRLLRQLLRRGEDNVVVSPTSLALALGMAAAGARGKTQAALELTLGSSSSEVANWAKRLLASLDDLPPGMTTEIADSLWVRSGRSLSPSYAAAMREAYRAAVDSLDFDLPSAPAVINDWVAHATHDQIRRVVESIDRDAVILLVNATYFHGRWAKRFDRKATVDHEFITASGHQTSVQLMRKSADFEYMENSEMQAVCLPYEQERFELLVVLPRRPLSAADFEAVAEPATVAGILAELEPGRPGVLALPKVRLGYEAKLKPELLEMGLGPAFGNDADFSGVFEGEVPSRISEVIQKTRLEIDEEGTTAAAATVIQWRSIGLVYPPPRKPFEMIVDRPFLMMLIESGTESPLFFGVIGDPTAG